MIISFIVRKIYQFCVQWSQSRCFGRLPVARYVTDETTKTKRLIGILTKRVCPVDFDTSENWLGWIQLNTRIRWIFVFLTLHSHISSDKLMTMKLIMWNKGQWIIIIVLCCGEINLITNWFRKTWNYSLCYENIWTILLHVWSYWWKINDIIYNFLIIWLVFY